MREWVVTRLFDAGANEVNIDPRIMYTPLPVIMYSGLTQACPKLLYHTVGNFQGIIYR